MMKVCDESAMPKTRQGDSSQITAAAAAAAAGVSSALGDYGGTTVKPYGGRVSPRASV